MFGHGARYREFGHKNLVYEVSLPIPYGSGGGWAAANRRTFITAQERLAEIFGGV